jgi:hypothetical protein
MGFGRSTLTGCSRWIGGRRLASWGSGAARCRRFCIGLRLGAGRGLASHSPLGTWNSRSRADRTRWSRGPDAPITQRLFREPPTGRAARNDRTREVRPDALVSWRTRCAGQSWVAHNETATGRAEELTGRHSASVRLESSKLPDRPDASGRLWPDAPRVRSTNWNTRRRWTLTGRVRSNRDRVRSSVRSPLWPPFASVWFPTSGVVENSRFNSSKTPETPTPNPLYRSNSNANANVLTPPSDHVMCECVSIFTNTFRGVISSIQMHMIMKCTSRGTLEFNSRAIPLFIVRLSIL